MRRPINSQGQDGGQDIGMNGLQVDTGNGKASRALKALAMSNNVNGEGTLQAYDFGNVMISP